MEPKKPRIAVGDVVTCLRRVEAYYSRRNGRPECWFEPGMRGRVVSVDVPCVTDVYKTDGGTPTFFHVVFNGFAATQEAALYTNNIEKVK